MSELRHSESGTRGVQRFVRRQISGALRALSDHRVPSDETVHDTRKRLKRARAGLRLLREEVGERRYRRENALVRDVARPLTELRDAKVLIDAFDEITEGVRNHAIEKELRPVRVQLQKRKREIRRRLAGDQGAIAQIRRSLRKETKRARQCTVGHRGWSVLGPGLSRVYRKGRRTLARAQREHSVENLHELRKQAKYLWNDLRILKPVAPRPIERRIALLDRLGHALGDDHDRAALRDYLSRHCSELSGKSASAVFSRIDRQRHVLERRSLAIATRIYADKPKSFARRMRDYWRAW